MLGGVLQMVLEQYPVKPATLFDSLPQSDTIGLPGGIFWG